MVRDVVMPGPISRLSNLFDEKRTNALAFDVSSDIIHKIDFFSFLID